MKAVAAWGGADILVNNAGIQHTAPLAEMPRETLGRDPRNQPVGGVPHDAGGDASDGRARLWPGHQHRLGARSRGLSRQGALCGREIRAGGAVSRVAALEYAAAGDKAKGGVTVNCICPGWTETAIIEPQIAARAAAHGGDRDLGIADLLAEKQPSRRTSDPVGDRRAGAVALRAGGPQRHRHGDPDRRGLDGAVAPLCVGPDATHFRNSTPCALLHLRGRFYIASHETLHPFHEVGPARRGGPPSGRHHGQSAGRRAERSGHRARHRTRLQKGKPVAVALAINSPGGSPAQSSLIAARIRRLAEEKEVPVHAFVEDVAASGGYWLACAADRIWADRTSILGSIGVISAEFRLS
jgi:hypothetical protein